MDKRYQVFVSSTFADLVEERQHLIQALLELDCIPAGMEMFPAANDDQWTLIQQVIDDCDYYLVVVAGRYGSIHPEKGISYTEMEYDYAVEKGKPVAGFIHSSPGKIELDKSEQSEKGRKKLEAFRKKVESKMVQFWDNPHDLGAKVSRSLVKLIKQNPAEGWVRSRHVVPPEDIAEKDRRIRELELEPQSLAQLVQTDENPLTEEAGQLLREAVRDKNGRIMSLGTSQGHTVSTNGIEFVSEGTGAEEAKWRGAVDELSAEEFIEDCGHKGEVFRVTSEGYKYADENKSIGHDEIDGMIASLSDSARCYLMTLSRPRNQEGIPISFFENRGGREAAHGQEVIEELLNTDVLKEGISAYTITKKGYEVADRPWAVYILRAVGSQQSGQYDYVEVEKIAEQVVLTDGDVEEQELQRHLASLADAGLVEPVPVDGGIGAARLTPNARAFTRNCVDIELASVE